MPETTQLGDRMKLYERMGAPRLMPGLPICVRLDGVLFSRYRKRFKCPHDEALQAAFNRLMIGLVTEYGALAGHTFSDEVSLIFMQRDYTSEPFYGGKAQKIASILASYATYWFNHEDERYVGNIMGFDKALFDCRVWNVPSLDEAANVLLWRILDAQRNSVAACAQAVFSHKQLHGKGRNEMRAMLAEKQEPWENWPIRSQWGQLAYRRVVEKPLDPVTLAKIPEGKRPEGPIRRSVVEHGSPSLRFDDLRSMLERALEKT